MSGLARPSTTLPVSATQGVDRQPEPAPGRDPGAGHDAAVTGAAIPAPVRAVLLGCLTRRRGCAPVTDNRQHFLGKQAQRPFADLIRRAAEANGGQATDVADIGPQGLELAQDLVRRA